MHDSGNFLNIIYIYLNFFNLLRSKYKNLDMNRLLILMFAFFMLMPIDANSQRKRNQKDDSNTQNVSLNAFKLRNVGPAFYQEELQI